MLKIYHHTKQMQILEINTDTEYTKKSKHNTYKTEKKQFFNRKPFEKIGNFNNFKTANSVKS